MGTRNIEQKTLEVFASWMKETRGISCKAKINEQEASDVDGCLLLERGVSKEVVDCQVKILNAEAIDQMVREGRGEDTDSIDYDPDRWISGVIAVAEQKYAGVGQQENLILLLTSGPPLFLRTIHSPKLVYRHSLSRFLGIYVIIRPYVENGSTARGPEVIPVKML